MPLFPATSYPIKGIEYYEPLNYSMEEVHRQHIAAVSLDNPVQFVRIRFFAFGRYIVCLVVHACVCLRVCLGLY